MLFYYAIGLFITILWIGRRRSTTSAVSINKLTRQTARWATAAQQDQSPLIALLHANYATGYLGALKDIATTRQINSASGIDVKKFEEHILNVQNSVTQKVLKECPDFAGKGVDLYLSSIAGEG